MDKIVDMGLRLSQKLNLGGLILKTYMANPMSMTEDMMNRFVLSITDAIRNSLRKKLCDPSELVDVLQLCLILLSVGYQETTAPVAKLFDLGLKAYFPTVSMDFKGGVKLLP